MRSSRGIPCRERQLGRKSRPPLSRGCVWAQMPPRRKGVAQPAREGALPLAIWVRPKHRAEKMILLTAKPSDSRLCFSIAAWLNKRTNLKKWSFFTHDCPSTCQHWPTWVLSVLGSPFIYTCICICREATCRVWQGLPQRKSCIEFSSLLALWRLIQNQKIIECSELEGTSHKDHQVQLVALHRTPTRFTPRFTPCAWHYRTTLSPSKQPTCSHQKGGSALWMQNTL